MQPQNPYPPQPQAQPPYGAIPPGQLPRKRRRWPWILALIVGIVILACAGGTVAVVLAVNNSPAKAASQHYFDSIKSQDYATAYSFLDPKMTLTLQGQQQQISQQTFTEVAQAYDSEKGKVSTYSIG